MKKVIVIGAEIAGLTAAIYLKGIANLHLAGRWLYTPGGLASAAATRR